MPEGLPERGGNSAPQRLPDPATARGYERRLRRVLQYIHDHPDGDLSLDALAEVAAMSRFHWHRVFRAMTGETCAQAVRRVRAYRASVWLCSTDWSVAEIARRAGYDNAQSFARVFRATFGQTPLAFRRSGAPGALVLTHRTEALPMQTVTIETLKARHLAAMTHIGPYNDIGKTYEQLGAVLGARGLWPRVRGMVAVYYDDPSSVAPEALRSHAGAEIDADFPVPEDLQEVILPAGRHAVLVFKGPYSGLQQAYDYVYGPWLAGSGETPGAAASYEVYLNSPMDTAPSDLLTQICVPLAS
ncbi:MAG: AraC family transcriptional regulator [Primorskyibacter sp.]